MDLPLPFGVIFIFISSLCVWCVYRKGIFTQYGIRVHSAIIHAVNKCVYCIIYNAHKVTFIYNINTQSLQFLLQAISLLFSPHKIHLKRPKVFSFVFLSFLFRNIAFATYTSVKNSHIACILNLLRLYLSV